MKYHKKLQKVLNLYRQKKMPAIESILFCDGGIILRLGDYRFDIISYRESRFWQTLENWR